MGTYTAERFHFYLLDSKIFKIASLYTNSPWSRLGEAEEDRLLNALEEGQTKNFDYILVGHLKEFFPGGITKSRVKIRVRIIEVKTRTTIFLADNYKEHLGHDRTYPLNSRLTSTSTAPEALAEKIVKDFIKKM